jgi:hypothetical protein
MRIFPAIRAFLLEKLDNDRLIFYAHIVASFSGEQDQRLAVEAQSGRGIEASER